MNGTTIAVSGAHQNVIEDDLCLIFHITEHQSTYKPKNKSNYIKLHFHLLELDENNKNDAVQN